MRIQRDKIKPIDFGKLKIIDYTQALDASSSIAEITVPPGASHEVSWSTRSDKYYYVIEGTLSLTVEGIDTELPAGDIAVIRKGQKFSYANSSDAPVKLLLVHTPGFILDCERFEE